MKKNYLNICYVQILSLMESVIASTVKNVSLFKTKLDEGNTVFVLAYYFVKETKPEEQWNLS